MPNISRNLTVAMIAALLVGGAGAEDRRENHAHEFAGDVDDFHSVLAPLWHSPTGAQRARDACARARELEGLAKAIRSADFRPLQASIAALKTQCQTGPGGIDAALSRVHEEFHRLVEAHGDSITDKQ